MEDNIKQFIDENKLFSSLDETTRNQLYSKFTHTKLLQNEVLYYQGEQSTALYLLVKGKLAAELSDITGERVIIGHINPGEPVGEVSVLSNEPHSLTIKALKDSEILRLSAEDFIALCHKHPSILIATIQPLISRSSRILHKHSSEKRNKHILIVAANETVSLEEFSTQMMHYSSSFKNILLLSDYQPEFSDKTITDALAKKIIQSLSENKKTSHRIIYILKSHITPLARIAFKKADLLYITAFANSKAKIDNHILDKISSPSLHLQSNPDLILIQPDTAKTPQNTSNWLSILSFKLIHHIRMHNTYDWHRLTRFIRGRAVGLVLSGGGTRGWAHLGAIKAIIKSKIPIDIVGGTSVGAIVAGCYASSHSYEEAYKKFETIVNKSNNSVSWRNLTWPVISIFNSKHFTQILHDVFTQTKIEDLWLSYFCISTNLATSHEEIHRSGVLWQKIRASASLPGMIPPMVIDGNLHMDGGLINNLPVDVMRQLIGMQGKIIAVDLNSETHETRKYAFPPVLSFTQALLAKFTITKQEYKFPRFTETFMRAMFVGSYSRAKQNSYAANIFVGLNLDKFRLLYSNPKQVNNLIEIGYQETMTKCMREIDKKMGD